MFKIEPRKNMHGWMGMNFYASKELKVPFHHKHKLIVEINKRLKPLVRHNTIKHEEIEYNLMRGGMHYHQAHKLALGFEKEHHRISKILQEIRNLKGGKK